MSATVTQKKPRAVSERLTPTLVQTKRKTPGRTRIAHISDLHFGPETDHNDSALSRLRQDLAAERANIDLIMVTGDLVESGHDTWALSTLEKAFSNARTFLETLAIETEVDPATGLVVVPGNHDCRVSGFMNNALLRLLGRSATKNSTQFYQAFDSLVQARAYPGLRLCVFPFDSNALDWGANFASGRVEPSDLDAFVDASNAFAKAQKKAWIGCTRLALVHHHPMPIAAAEERSLFVGREEWMLLKNAGQFMGALVRQGVEVVLHGHKHWPSSSKATFFTDQDGFRTIAVVAAGSAGPGSIGRGKKSYNRVTLDDADGVSVQRVHLEDTYTSGSPRKLLEYEEARTTKHRRSVESSNPPLRVPRFSRYHIIRDSGDVEITETFEEVRSRDREINTVDISLGAGGGFFQKPQYRSLSDSCHVAFDWTGPKIEGFRPGQISFQPPLTTEGHCSFSARHLILDGIHFNQRDRRREYESISVSTSRFLTDSLSILVQLPPKASLAEPPRVSVLTEEKQPDSAEQRYAQRSLLWFREQGTIVLRLEKPIHGYQYEITWKLPETDPADGDQVYEGEQASALIARLRDLEQAPPDNSVRRLLDSLHEEVKDRCDREHRGGGDLSLVMAVWLAEERLFEMVSAVGKGCEGWTGRRVDAGSTVIGRALRRGETIRWLPKPAEADHDRDHWDYGQHDCILAIPLFFPIDRTRRVGALSIGGSHHPGLRILLARQDGILDLVSRVSKCYRAIVSELLQGVA